VRQGQIARIWPWTEVFGSGSTRRAVPGSRAWRCCSGGWC